MCGRWEARGAKLSLTPCDFRLNYYGIAHNSLPLLGIYVQISKFIILCDNSSFLVTETYSTIPQHTAHSTQHNKDTGIYTDIYGVFLHDGIWDGTKTEFLEHQNFHGPSIQRCAPALTFDSQFTVMSSITYEL